MRSPISALQHRLSLALRDRVAGPDAERRAHAIWLAPGPRRFAPDDPIARVQGHAAMYAGGIRALLLQSLHPLAMAGVGEHSGYRGDPWGRLQRTSEFIAMTTFGPEEGAARVLERINRVHTTVVGTASDGRPYSATDPHLLTWVHIAEIESFLTAYQRYARTPLTLEEADRYVEQTAWAAGELGVPDPPLTVMGLYEQLGSFEPELAASDGARDVVRFLLTEPPLPTAARPGFWLLAAGAVEMLPQKARDLLDLHLPVWARQLERPLLRYVARPAGGLGTAAVGWALGSPDDPRNDPESSATYPG
ncbi:MAG: oxygenase MpaB family protein [Ornithinimicrobium sp.]|uniref:oxygenase MpaB family protein n=1 Tax=Ornithinimicrobium sp. TaxID=1977084 RepID=UPI0026DF0AAD|nr:oxygenase MpaB family protein [Ornithinimicrobium sp.]MDO5740342.1 oxygenase MpaB family protein [Ornithinimicrobium sp.]